ncbi:MAG: ABC transporter permease [Trueperaceae bacterium]
MLAYALRRIVDVIPVLIVITLLAFLVFYFDPSDPVVMIAGESATPEVEAAIRDRLGLDRPAHIQYLTFLGNVAQGDFGTSYRSRQPVASHVWPAFQATLVFTSVALVLMIVIGVPAGIVSATRPYSLLDSVVMSTVLIGLSAPIFWVGIVLMYLFAFVLGWLPTGGFYSWKGVILPAVTLALQYGAIVARITRASMLDALDNDYIRTARAKGVSDRVVFYQHALKNASLPIVTTIGLQIGSMLGGTILIETVFAWPGVGRMLVNAIVERDAPIVQAGVLLIATAVLVLNLLTDWVYGLLDPRVRLA